MLLTQLHTNTSAGDTGFKQLNAAETEMKWNIQLNIVVLDGQIYSVQVTGSIMEQWQYD